MKYNRLLLLLLLSPLFSFSQTILLRTGAVSPAPNISQKTVDSFSLHAPRFAGTAFAVLQFDQLPSADERTMLSQNGIVLLDYLPQNAYRVAIKGTPSVRLLRSVRANSLFTLSPQQKMQDYFSRGVVPSWAVEVPGTVDVWISFYQTLDANTVLQELKALNADIRSTEHLAYRVISLRIAAGRVAEIAALPFVEYIQPAPPKAQPLNYNSRVQSRANVLNAAVDNGGRGLNGEGVTVGHGDNADVQAHADFNGRIINRNASPFNAHGVHTAGILAGAGNINELYRGYAPKATIVSQSFSGIIDNAATYARDYGMVITNNSYGNVIECDYHGTYDLTARILDQQAFDLPHLLHVFSAGNSGLNACQPYEVGYHTVLGGYQSAKNSITVGATNDSGEIANFSSRGPVRDGRLKPEIVAMGQGVISSWPVNIYSPNNGTSMAAPAVSGGLALLYQRYRQLNGGANPPNALMKAVLCNGANDRGATGPDFTYGFGGMNLLRSVDMLEGGRYFAGSSSAGSTATHTITVPANTAQLKVLLYWNDLPASVISTKNLVNDLDLDVTGPTGATVLPALLDTTGARLGNAATTGADHLNNIEQVIISNPVAGTYTLRVRGTTVTNDQQAYYLAYDPVPMQLKLTAPAGDMALVPGEKTKISWDSYGLTGTATLSFSGDGGSTWLPIASGVNVNRFVYTWIVPNVPTGKARIRITKDGSGESVVSNPFTILAQPVLSLAPVQCESYFSINWTPVAGATDYEVMLLRGAEMKPVATTAQTGYTFSGLSKDSVYFASVRARTDGKPGRRAVAMARQPNTGTCSGSVSDGDLAMVALLSPASGRIATSTERGAAEPVTVRVKNLDDSPVSNFTVGYWVNGAVVTETVAGPVAAGSTYTHTFSTTVHLSSAGVYPVTVFVKNAGDANAANDTLSALVKQISNDRLLLTAPFLDDVETAVSASYEKDTLGIAGDERYDFSHTTPYGRLRTFVNTGFAYSGQHAFTLDANRYVAAGNVNYLYGSFNLANYAAAANDLRLDFRYRHHGQISNEANRVWIRGSDTSPWIPVYNLDTISAQEGVFTKTASIELSSYLLANGQAYTSSFGVRWGQWGQWPATDKENAAGYTIDDIRLYEVHNDVQMLRVESPQSNSCGLSAATAITVTVRNSSGATLTNVPVRYRVNGGTFVTESIPFIPARTSVTYTFSATANFSNAGPYTIETVSAYAADTFTENDTAARMVYNQPVISSFPYLETFEKGDGHFYAEGRRSSWAYGTPNSRKIKGAASGTRAWKTNLEGLYNDKELSYLYSPCFDLTGLAAPTLSFSVAMDIEDCGSGNCDAAWVEYSVDGLSWKKLGTDGAGTNWYNKPSPRSHWSIENNTWWHVATQPLPVAVGRLRLRFVMAADAGLAREGIAIDDFHLYDNTNGIYGGPSLSAPLVQPVPANNWTHFTAGGKLVASVKPASPLGNTAVQAFMHQGAARSANNQYYLNRNITIKPSAPTSDSVLVRIYFLDSESDSLRLANTCPGCSKPASAYALGVTQYSDADTAKENGNLGDNEQGLWNFIPPTAVTTVPFDKGYYAEFKADGFSEFWLNGGGSLGNAPLPVKLMTVTATRQGVNGVVNWKVGSETDVLRYEIEMARDASALQAGRFEKIGEVAGGANTTATRDYTFTDGEPDKFGTRYYRLRIVNRDGRVQYSPVRSVVFAEAVLWNVYPNPGGGDFSLIYQFGAGENVSAGLYDAAGRLVKEYRSTATGVLQKLSINISANNYASGLYLLRIRSGEQEQVFKLYKQ